MSGKNWNIFTYNNNEHEYFKFIELFPTDDKAFLIMISRASVRNRNEYPLPTKEVKTGLALG